MIVALLYGTAKGIMIYYGETGCHLKWISLKFAAASQKYLN